MKLFAPHPAWTTRKKRTPLRASIDLAALVSILFTLTFIVLFANTYPLPHHQIPTDVPITQNSTQQLAALRDDALEVILTRDGTVYFRNIRCSPEDLPDLIRDAVREGADKTVYLKADSRAKYGDVKFVLSQIRQSGLQNITFLTDHPAH